MWYAHVVGHDDATSQRQEHTHGDELQGKGESQGGKLPSVFVGKTDNRKPWAVP